MLFRSNEEEVIKILDNWKPSYKRFWENISECEERIRELKGFDVEKFEEELLKLQTYKMFEGGEKLVELDEVLELLQKQKEG